MNWGEIVERFVVYGRQFSLRLRGKRVPSIAALKWWRAEQLAARRFDLVLSEHLLILEQIEELAFDALKALVSPNVPQAVLHAHSALLARVLQDLRCTGLLACSGYAMQSWTVAASCFEAAHSIGFIGVTESRAQRWLEHQSLDQAPWSAYDAVQGTILFLELEADPEERKRLTEREYDLYKRLCIGKHANPLSEKNRYLLRHDERLRLRLTPFFHDRHAKEARLALVTAARAATSALWVFIKANFPGEEQYASRLLSIMSATYGLAAESRE